MAKQLPPQSPIARAEAKKKYEDIYRRYTAGSESLSKLLKEHGVGEAAYHKWRRTHRPEQKLPQRSPRPVAAFGGDVERSRASTGSQLLLCSMENLNRIVSEAVDEALKRAVSDGRIKTVDL